jgi:hypothetical protein
MHSPLIRVLPLLGLCAALAAQTGTVEGDVVDSATNKPIAGARVKLQNGQRSLFTMCDQDGHFQFQEVPFGRYPLTVEQPGYMAASDGPNMRGPTTMADMPRDKGRATVHVALIPYGVITGKVTDSAGAPLEGVNVDLLKLRAIDPNLAGLIYQRRALVGDREIASVFNVRTDDRGEYRLARLLPGEYYVDAQAGIVGGYRDETERTTYYPRVLEAAAAKPIAVAAGQQVSHIDIQLVRQTGVRISGRLIQPAGSPAGRSIMVHTLVLAWRADAPQEGSVIPTAVMSQANFEVKNILPGKYVVEAGVSDQTDYGNPRLLLTGSRTIEVGDRDLGGVEIVMRAPVDVSGVLTFPANCQASPVLVWPQTVSHLPGPRSPQTISTAGAFTLRGLLPGRYSLRSSPPPASVKLGDGESSQDSFEITGEPPGQLRIDMTCGGRGVVR